MDKLLTNSAPVQKEVNQDFYSNETEIHVNTSCRKILINYDRKLDESFTRDLTTLAGA